MRRMDRALMRAQQPAFEQRQGQGQQEERQSLSVVGILRGSTSCESPVRASEKVLSTQKIEDQRHHRDQGTRPQAGASFLPRDEGPGGLRRDEAFRIKAWAGAGANKGAGKTYVPGWIRPGRTHSAIDLRVGCEPRGAGAHRGNPKPVITQSLGHGRLSSRTFWGAGRRQGPRSSPRRSHRLDLDGWLVRSTTDTKKHEGPAAEGDHWVTSHHVATRQGYGICGKLLRTFQQIPQPRRLDEVRNSMIQRSGAAGTRPGKLYPLDTGLLMDEINAISVLPTSAPLAPTPTSSQVASVTSPVSPEDPRVSG